MHTHRFRAALAAAAILLPMLAGADTAPSAGALLPNPAHVVVDRILAERETLALGSQQVAALSELAERLRAHRGRLQLVGLDGVPGKSVPRYIRVFPTSEEALRQALDLLTPEQRSESTRLLRAGTAAGLRREGDSR